MPYKATIKTGLRNVVLGGRGPLQGDEVVLLSDEEMSRLRPEVLTVIFNAAPTALNTTTTSPYP